MVPYDPMIRNGPMVVWDQPKKVGGISVYVIPKDHILNGPTNYYDPK